MSAADDDKPTVTVRFRSPTAFRLPQSDIDELRTELVSDNYSLTVEPPEPPKEGIYNSLEAVGIFLAGAASTKLLDAALKDAYDGTKRWLRKRFDKDDKASSVVVTIYGPDNKPLKNVLGRPPNIIKDLDV